ncbi:MAG: PIN domain-containing protein [Opitutales bacterium]
MMGRALLDASVRITLLDEADVHHRIAADWLRAHGDEGIATCPLTENASVRLISSPAYRTVQAVLQQVLAALIKLRLSWNHAIWADCVSLTDSKLFLSERLEGHKQLTDIYLLGLAQVHEGRLVTCDRGLSTRAIRNPREDLLQC